MPSSPKIQQEALAAVSAAEKALQEAEANLAAANAEVRKMFARGKEMLARADVRVARAFAETEVQEAAYRDSLRRKRIWKP